MVLLHQHVSSRLIFQAPSAANKTGPGEAFLGALNAVFKISALCFLSLSPDNRNIRSLKQPPMHNSPGFFPHFYLKALRECSTVSFCKIIRVIIPSYQDHAISVLAALTSEMAPPCVGRHRCYLVTHSPSEIGIFLAGSPKDANRVSSFW